MGLCHRAATGFEICELPGGSAGGDCASSLGHRRRPGLYRGFCAGLLWLLYSADLPSDLAAIQFDRSGTTHIGRFVINHSFILPGLIGVGVSCVFGWVFAAMYGFL